MRFAAALLALALVLPAPAQEPEEAKDAWTEACDEYVRLKEEAPDDLEKRDAAIRRIHDLAKEDWQIASYNRIKTEYITHVALLRSFVEGESVRDAVAAGKDLDVLQKTWRGLAKSVYAIDWPRKRSAKWGALMLEVIGELKKRGEKAKSATPPDWIEAGKSYRLAVEVSETGPRGLAINQDLPALMDLQDAALEKMYFATKWAEPLPWKDALDHSMGFRADLWIATTRDGAALVLDNASEKVGGFEMDRPVPWRDYAVKMEFTLDEGSGFSILVRKAPKGEARFTYDLGPLVKAGTLKAGARQTVEFSVFGEKAKMTAAGSDLGSPRPWLRGPGSGGFALKLPAGVKVTLHTCEVRILYSAE